MAPDRTQQLLEHLEAFCAARLDDDYRDQCHRVVELLRRQQPLPYQHGRIEIWTAAVVHAVGNQNFLFDPASEPHLTPRELAAAFGTAMSSISRRSRQIRDLLGLRTLPQRREWHEAGEAMGRAARLFKLLMRQRAGEEIDPAEVQRLIAPYLAGEREFVDCDRPLAEPFAELCRRYVRSGPTHHLERTLRRMVKIDPDFLGSYALLGSVRRQQGRDEEAEACVDEAYRRAVALVTAPDGRWPDLAEWHRPENQHIFVAFLNRLLGWWQEGHTEPALELARRLLRCHPDDVVGVRARILALREGMALDEFDGRFVEDGRYKLELWEWFAAHAEDYRDEFGWWMEEVGWE